MINRLDEAVLEDRCWPTSTTIANPIATSKPPPPTKQKRTTEQIRTSKGGIGSRRIFAPHFKLQVLDSYRRDSDCMGNQRATARKYGIHRRQIQKWLQMETQLRSTVEETESTVTSSTTVDSHANNMPLKVAPLAATTVEEVSKETDETSLSTTNGEDTSENVSTDIDSRILNLSSSTRLNENSCQSCCTESSETSCKTPSTGTRRAEPPLSPGHERITLGDEEDSDIEVDVDGTSSDEEEEEEEEYSEEECGGGRALDLTCSALGKRRFFSTEFKLGVLDAFYNDSSCTGNQRATARKFGVNRRQIQKWLQQEYVLRGDCLDLTCKRRKLEPSHGHELLTTSCATATTTATCCPLDLFPPPASSWPCFLPPAWPYPQAVAPTASVYLPGVNATTTLDRHHYKLFRPDSFLTHRQPSEIKVYGLYR